MKRQIFLYLFVFALLLILFQYMNSKRIYEDQNKKMESLKVEAQLYQDSIASLTDRLSDCSHFQIENNEDALTYFEDDGHNVNDLIPYIKDELYNTNEYDTQHPLVPYESSKGRKMLINTVKILNHKWIIADFSDGEYWGEILLTYEISKDKEINFNRVEAFLYPFD